jgi:hypothetical protein
MLATFLPFLPKLIAGVGAIIGGALLFFGVRQSGVQAQQNADLKQSLKNVETANATSADVARLPDAAVDQRLRSEFSRD